MPLSSSSTLRFSLLWFATHDSNPVIFGRRRRSTTTQSLPTSLSFYRSALNLVLLSGSARTHAASFPTLQRPNVASAAPPLLLLHPVSAPNRSAPFFPISPIHRFVIIAIIFFLKRAPLLKSTSIHRPTLAPCLLRYSRGFRFGAWLNRHRFTPLVSSVACALCAARPQAPTSIRAPCC